MQIENWSGGYLFGITRLSSVATCSQEIVCSALTGKFDLATGLGSYQVQILEKSVW